MNRRRFLSLLGLSTAVAVTATHAAHADPVKAPERPSPPQGWHGTPVVIGEAGPEMVLGGTPPKDSRIRIKVTT